MQISLIAAIGRNNELGKDNDLIWRLKGDMRFFKETTMGHSLIMGRKTFDSLPRLLEGRRHLVLTKQDLDFPSEVEVYKDISDFLNKYQDTEEEIFDIGGASMYSQFIDYADNLYLTEINAECPTADVYFPKFDRKLYDRIILDEKKDDEIEYSHVLYKRKK